jgi:hypothetical protein
MSGLYVLPFFGCDDKVFRFWVSTNTDSKNLGGFREVRELGPAERWCGRNGNIVETGCVTGLDCPDVSIGPVLAGRVAELNNTKKCRYILILKGKLNKNPRDRESYAHLNGDPVYQWVSYPSRERAEASLGEAFRMGYSVECDWAEIETSDVGALEKVFIGDTIKEEGRTFFAVFCSKA